MEMVQQFAFGFPPSTHFPNLFFCHPFKAAGLPISFVAVAHNNSNCFKLQGSLFLLVIIICMIIKQTGILPNHSNFSEIIF